MMRQFSLGSVLLLLSLAVYTGCTPTDSTSDATDAQGEHDHDHDHDHGTPGPHGGHTEKFDQAGYTFEWIHDDPKQLVRIVILDEAMKNPVPVKAEAVTIVSGTGQTPQTFTLAPVSPDEAGKASEFQLKDGALIVALGLGVDVSIDIDGTTYTKKLEQHEHHDH